MLASYVALTYAHDPYEPRTNATSPFPTDVCAVYTAWPTDQPGVPLTAQLPDAELTSMLSEIDLMRIKAIIEKLASYGTRHTQNSQTDPNCGIGAARDWLLTQY